MPFVGITHLLIVCRDELAYYGMGKNNAIVSTGRLVQYACMWLGCMAERPPSVAPASHNLFLHARVP